VPTTAFRAWINELETARGGRVSPWRRLSPPQLFVGSFLALVVLGTLGLRLLPGLYTGARLGWLDAAFTATSATCVTGLAVVDTGTFFTPLGQAFLLLLIQLGGLGMIAFTTVIILALGRRLSLRQESLAAGALDGRISPERLARDVVRFTLGLEALGALALWALWGPRLGWRAAAWPAVFHAVSAFCNAGFSTFADSLIGFQRSPLTLLTIGTIVVAGGIGFLTMEELALMWRTRRHPRPHRLSLHSRLVLVTTGVLLVAGWVLFALAEWHNQLDGLPLGDRLVNALFLSITPRTAGFNNIDYGRATDPTNFLTILLMFVGGSPGSTAGGVKTTTLAIVALLALSRFRGHEDVTARHRTIPEETVQRAVGLAAVALAAVTASILVLSWGEHTAGGRGAFLAHMFEAVSAFNTVGLSTGITASVSPSSRVLLIVLMFVGRVGPLTFAAALAVAARRERARYRYAREDVVVG
jgi:trk system potassium uptake protein TrkH